MPNEQHHEGRGRSKSRGQSQEPRSKSRGRGGGSSAGLRTTTTTTTSVGRGRKSRRRGGGGGGQQHQQHEHPKQKSLAEQQKELDEKKEKASEMSRNQREMNEKIKEKYEAQLFEILSKYDDTEGRTDKAYTSKRKALMQTWENDKVIRDYDSMSECDKKKYDSEWKRDIAKELKEMLRGQKIFGLPSKQAIQKEFYAEQKKIKAQLAPPGPHVHTHGRATDHAAAHKKLHQDNIAPGPSLGDGFNEVGDGPREAQFSYDKELWGATHTRRYL